ncbi:hypothetical protein IAU60_000352 [Kwoniella sp. DSM 27419]
MYGLDQIDAQPVAGPSSRPYMSSSYEPPDIAGCTSAGRCPWLQTLSGEDPSFVSADPSLRPSKVITDRSVPRKYRRQDNAQGQQSSAGASSTGATSIASAPYATATEALSSTSSSRPLFAGPSPTESPTEAYNSSAPYPTNPSSSFTDVDGFTSSSSASSSSHHSTTFTSLWTYSATRTRTSSASTPSESIYVPGVIMNMTFAGDSDTEAVYSVDCTLGHQAPGSMVRWNRRRRAYRRAPAWNGRDAQVVSLQVDLGSADMWVATSDCTSSDCRAAGSLFDVSQSLDSGVSANITYQSGAVSGDIYWEEINVGDFGIGYQAFIGATTVTNEDLDNGQFDGVLGLALPASSTILQTIGGTTGSNPDGATFLDNLFGAGSSAPTERLFALSLARREDVRTSSTLGIGTVVDEYCPKPCEPPYVPIIAQPQLGTTGYVHWRVPLQGVSVTTWADEADGTGPTTTNVTLGASQVYPQRTTPLAVLDSGGVQILVGWRPYADAIYAAVGVSMSPDGFYRMPCKQQIALTFNIAGQSVPVHPLDMTYPDPEEASQTQCIGMIQYSDNLGDSGDFILGSSFLKNAYSIYQYPDTNKQKTWQPTVGLVPLTNASTASQDFYAVRVKRESLSSVSANQQAANGGSSTSSNPNSPSGSAAVASDKKALSSGVIAAVGAVVGFFVIAAIAFCAWWFWLRKKYGAGGRVEYKTGPVRPGVTDHKSDGSMSSLRTRKHDSALRQRSMVEGYADYEGDSWMSTTEGNESIRLGYLPEVLEEDEGRRTRAADRRSSRGSTIPADKANGEEYELVDMADPFSPTTPQPRSRTRSPPPFSPTVNEGLPPEGLAAEAAPLVPALSSSATKPQAAPRALSLSMSGPFPSPGASRMSGPFPSPGPGSGPGGNRASIRPDASPMYDIRTSDYFSVPPSSGTPASRGREHRRGSSVAGIGREGARELSVGRMGSAAGRRKSSPSKLAEAGIVPEEGQ